MQDIRFNAPVSGDRDMSIHNVVINNDTTGIIDTDTLDGQSPEDFMGEYVTIKAHDENGNPVEHYGRLTEVLDQ